MRYDLKLLVSGMLLAVVLACVGIAQMREVIGFRVPEYDDQNVLKSELSGDRALFVGEDEVHITNLVIETFRDEKVDTRATSPESIYYRSTRNIESDSNIMIERENITITGRDYFYNHAENRFEIRKDAKVVVKSEGIDFFTGDRE